MKPDDPRRRNLKRGGSAGRPKGCLNKVTREVKELALRLIANKPYQRALKRRLRDGSAPNIETLLWYYAYGKPKETFEHNVSGGVLCVGAPAGSGEEWAKQYGQSG